MKKEEILLLAQLLTGMKDAINLLDKAQKKKDLEGIASAKLEILNLQRQIDMLL